MLLVVLLYNQRILLVFKLQSIPNKGFYSQILYKKTNKNLTTFLYMLLFIYSNSCITKFLQWSRFSVKLFSNITQLISHVCFLGTRILNIYGRLVYWRFIIFILDLSYYFFSQKRSNLYTFPVCSNFKFPSWFCWYLSLQ